MIIWGIVDGHKGYTGMNHKNLSFGETVCRHMTVSLGIIASLPTLRPFFAWSTLLSSSSNVVISCCLLKSKPLSILMLLHMPLLVIIYHLCPPLHILPSPQSLQLWLNIPAHSHPPPQWLAIIWMLHSIWNWDTWMNIIGYFPINPFQFKTPNSGSPPASVFMGMASTVLLTSDPCWRHVMGACLGHRVDI